MEKSFKDPGYESAHLFGQAPEHLRFLDNGVRYKSFWMMALMTGIFLDQRVRASLVDEAAAQVNPYSICFPTAAFSVAAAMGGAGATGDLAKRSQELSQAHFVAMVNIGPTPLYRHGCFDYYRIPSVMAWPMMWSF